MKNKAIFLLIGVIIIIIGVYFSLRYQPELNPGSDSIESGENNIIPEDQFKDVQLFFYNSDGSIVWHLESELLNNYNQNRVLDLSPVQIAAVESSDSRFNGENYSAEQVLYYLTASDSSYNIDSGIIGLAGPIEINKDEITFRAVNLTWQEGKDRISATGGVSIESPDFHIKGENLEGDIALDNVSISGKEEQAFFTWKKGSDSD